MGTAWERGYKGGCPCCSLKPRRLGSRLANAAAGLLTNITHQRNHPQTPTNYVNSTAPIVPRWASTAQHMHLKSARRTITSKGIATANTLIVTSRSNRRHLSEITDIFFLFLEHRSSYNSGTNCVSVTSKLSTPMKRVAKICRGRCTWRQKTPGDAYLLCRQMQLWVSCMSKCTILLSLPNYINSIAAIVKYHHPA